MLGRRQLRSGSFHGDYRLHGPCRKGAELGLGLKPCSCEHFRLRVGTILPLLEVLDDVLHGEGHATADGDVADFMQHAHDQLDPICNR